MEVFCHQSYQNSSAIRAACQYNGKGWVHFKSLGWKELVVHHLLHVEYAYMTLMWIAQGNVTLPLFPSVSFNIITASSINCT